MNTPTTQNPIEQAIEALRFLLDACEDWAKTEELALPNNAMHYAERAIIALRALQNVKMRSVFSIIDFFRDRLPFYNKTLTPSYPEGFLKEVFAIQKEAFTVGLMAQPDAKAIRDQALEEAAKHIVREYNTCCQEFGMQEEMERHGKACADLVLSLKEKETP